MSCFGKLIYIALLVLLSSCDNYDDKYLEPAGPCDGADAIFIINDDDDGVSCGHPSYGIMLEVEVQAGESESSAEVDVLFISRHAKGDSYYDENKKVETIHGHVAEGRMIHRGDTPFENKIDITLKWSCDASASKKEVKFSKPANADRASTSLTGLPAKPNFDQQDISCELEAEANITYYIDPKREEGALVENSHTFTIETKTWEEAEYDYMVKLDIKPTRGDNQSYADVTAAIVGKDGKTAAKKGDQPYDEAVDVDVHWGCGDISETSYKSGREEVVVAANKASVTTRITLPGVSSTSDALSCVASASVSLNDTIVATTKEDVPFVLGDRVLSIFVQEATNTQAISYSVSENNQELSGDVQLSISGAYCGMLLQLNAAHSKVNYGTIAKAKAKSSGSSPLAERIYLGGDGNACTLLATAGSKTGSSSSFAINSGSSPPFTLNKNNATISASSKYTGKVYVYLYDSTKSSSNLVAYLNASDVTSATKLKASAAANAGNATLNSSKKYIVFAEVSGVLHVFSM